MPVVLFYTFIISFFLGIFVRSFFSLPIVEFTFTVFVFLVVFSILKFSGYKISNSIFFIFLFIFGFTLGSVRYDFFEKSNHGDFEHKVNQQVSTQVVIVDEPEEKGFQTKLTVEFEHTKTRAILWTQSFPKYTYGDMLLVTGFINYPQNFASPSTGKTFDYISYLKKDRIFYELKPLSIKLIGHDKANPLKKYLFEIKNSFLGQIKKLIPSSEASLLGGILLGAKEDMGKDLLDDFRKTGVIHIVVLSGYNLTLVAEFFIKIFAFMGVYLSSIFGAVAIVFFTIMTGASSTIIRASLMALLILFARTTGRTSETTRALFVAGLLMLLFNPMLLVYDPSFQLSFLATLGLLVLSPKIEEWLSIIPKGFLDFRGILSATIATQIFVFPLLLYMMGEISVISPIVNVLILIFIPFLMFVGLIAVLVSYLNFSIGLLIAYIAYIILSYDLFIVDIFANLPFAVFSSSNFTFWHMLIWYFSYFLIFLFSKIHKKYLVDKTKVF